MIGISPASQPIGALKEKNGTHLQGGKQMALQGSLGSCKKLLRSL